jgi:TRAP-type transport system periplasmic protein
MRATKISRRRVMSGVAGVGAVTILHWPANAAEFTYKFGASSPMEHPAMARTKIAADKIREASNGRLDISIFPSSQLGGDTAMISQVISGAMQMYLLPIDLLAPRKSVCGITGTGFAFPNYDAVWAAMDGDLGKLLRSAAAELGIYCLETSYDHGFRQITAKSKAINGPGDLHGFKIRLPVAPYFLVLFRHLGAAPTSMNFSEVYSALQTGVVDGQENPLVLIDTAKLYEVQKYCSLTNHICSGFHVGFNVNAWKKLPADLQGLVTETFTAEVRAQRQDFLKMTQDEQMTLTAKGMVFNTPDIKPFREVLAKSGFYLEIKNMVGSQQAWDLLQKYVGNLG